MHLLLLVNIMFDLICIGFLSCEERKGGQKIKIKIYVSIGIRTLNLSPAWMLTRWLRPFGLADWDVELYLEFW